MRLTRVLAVALLAAAPARADVARRRSAVVDVVQKVAPAVVFIGTEQVVDRRMRGSQLEEFFFGEGGSRTQRQTVAVARLGSDHRRRGDHRHQRPRHPRRLRSARGARRRPAARRRGGGDRRQQRPRRAPGRLEDALARGEAGHLGGSDDRRDGGGDRQPLRPEPRRSPRAWSPRSAAASRPTSSSTTTSCRPTRPSTPATRAGRCSTSTARSSASTPPSSAAPRASASPSPRTRCAASSPSSRSFGKVRPAWVGINAVDLTARARPAARVGAQRRRGGRVGGSGQSRRAGRRAAR